MKKIIFSYLLFFGFLEMNVFSQNFPNVLLNGPLKVAENSHYLVHENGKPFFWLGDTAWELFHRLNKDQADYYLKRRAEQGYTVIQAVALAEFDGLHVPNPYGELPLNFDDLSQPNEKYFQHVDYIIDKAAENGLYIAFLPTWGDKLFKSGGKGPEFFTPENAKTYGKYLGNRYKERKNIIWILGGDRNPRPGSKDLEVWRQMADRQGALITKANKNSQLLLLATVRIGC